MYSDLFSDLTQKMAPQPIKGSQLCQKRMEFQFRWQLITNHSVFARSRNVQITGVGGLVHSCNIVNPYQTWNQTCSVCVKVSKHTFWSAFGALHCAIYGNVFNISRETSFGNLGDNTCDVGGTRNNGRGGGLPRWWARFEERFNAALWHFGNGLFDVDLRAWCFDGDFMFFHHSW